MTTKAPDDDLLTPAEVRKMLRVSRQTILRWADAGLLPPVRISTRTTRYRRADVEKLLSPEKSAS